MIKEFKIGDYITGTPDNNELTTNRFALLRVVRIFNSMIEVRLIAHKKQSGFVGKPYYIQKVDLSNFIKWAPPKQALKKVGAKK